VSLLEKPHWAHGNPLKLLRDPHYAFGSGLCPEEKEHLLDDIYHAQKLLKNDDLRVWLLGFFQEAERVVSSFRASRHPSVGRREKVEDPFDLKKDRVEMFPSIPNAIEMKRALNAQTCRDPEFVKCMESLTGRDYLIVCVEIFCLNLLDVKHKFCNPNYTSQFLYKKQHETGPGVSATDRRDLLHMLNQAMVQISFFDNIKTIFLSEIKKAYGLVNSFRSHSVSSQLAKRKASTSVQGTPPKRRCESLSTEWQQEEFKETCAALKKSAAVLQDKVSHLADGASLARSNIVYLERQRRYMMMREKSEALLGEYYVPSGHSPNTHKN